MRLLDIVLAELGPGLRHAAAHVLLLDPVVVLDVDRVVVHLVAVPVDLQRHVFVLEVAVQFVLHRVVCFYLLVHLQRKRMSLDHLPNIATHLGKHLLHSLLVGLDVLHLPLKAVLHLVLDKVDADPRLPVLDALIVDPVKNGK